MSPTGWWAEGDILMKTTHVVVLTEYSLKPRNRPLSLLFVL